MVVGVCSPPRSHNGGLSRIRRLSGLGIHELTTSRKTNEPFTRALACVCAFGTAPSTAGTAGLGVTRGRRDSQAVDFGTKRQARDLPRQTQHLHAVIHHISNAALRPPSIDVAWRPSARLPVQRRELSYPTQCSGLDLIVRAR
jgi:hypothetical protein